MVKLVVYVLCYDDRSRQAAEKEWGDVPWARVVTLPDDPRTARYMEGAAFLDLLPSRRHEWQDADFVGTLSWKARDKICVPAIFQEAVEKEVGAADVLALLPSTEGLAVQAQRSHPRFLEVWVPLLQRLGYEARDAVAAAVPLFLCNYWLATPAWMERYLGLYDAATTVLDTDRDIREALWDDAGYGSHLSEERCRQIYGTPYIPYHPFVCERLPCFFFWKERAAVKVLPLGRKRFWDQYYGWEAANVRARAELQARVVCMP